MPLSTSLQRLAWLRLLGASLLLALVLAPVFSALVWWRLQGLNSGNAALIEAGCLGLEPMAMADCINQNLFVWLWQPTWVARVFSLQTLLATLIVWLLLRRQPTAPVHGLLLGLMSGSMLLLVLEPGRLTALCSLLGAGLGGLLANWGQRHTRSTLPAPSQ